MPVNRKLSPGKPSKVQEKISKFTSDWKSREAVSCPPLVKVSWLDACIHQGSQLYTEPGWETRYNPGVYMETVGYLLRADSDWVTLAMERKGEKYQEGCYREWQDIPRYSISNLEILKKAKG